MTIRQNTLAFVGGVLLGFIAAVSLGAADKGKDPTKKDWSRIRPITYPNGATGLFDTDSGTIYLYDSDLRSCYLVRQLTRLGDPMIRP
jgi:hypothetical protein